MVEPQLQSVKANLFADKRAGMVPRHDHPFHPKSWPCQQGRQLWSDCAHSTAELIYASFWQTGTGHAPRDDAGAASLVLSGSTWKGVQAER